LFITSKNNIFNLELSGCKFKSNHINQIKNYSKNNNIVLHNYYLSSKKNFVINLASLDPKIEELSINYILEAIQLSSDIDSRYYSFHSGFRFDPKPNMLGKKFRKEYLYDLKKCKVKFYNNVNLLAKFAKKLNIKLLVENNVITKNNLQLFGENPLLLCDISEIKEFFSKIDSRDIGLLMDVGHFKVSSRTLNFDLESSICALNQYIKGYHLSENDAEQDSNFHFDNKSWFWKNLNKKLDYYSVEVKSKNIKLLQSQISSIKEFIND
jgi:sugar phosphate isomerase/epimerase